MSISDNLYGIFGGTFDPIHYGHLALGQEALQAAALSQVIYIPAAVPPHRQPPFATAKHRLAMTHLAVAEVPQFAVDDIELRRCDTSYTIDTVESLQRQHPQRRYVLIIGMDALLTLETWRHWQRLQNSVHIMVIARHGWQLPQTLPTWWQDASVESGAELRRSDSGKIIFMATPPPPISATLVRARLHAGEAVSDLTPNCVCDYIRTHNLYRNHH